MASQSLIPRCGSVLISCDGTNSVYLADFAAFNITASQIVENVTPYDNNRSMTKNRGNGTVDWDITIAGYALSGATGNAPGLTGFRCGASCGPKGSACDGGSDGATAGLFWSEGIGNQQLNGNGTPFGTTFTLDTNVTYSGTIVVSRVEIMHARMRAAVNVNISAKNADDFCETWAVS